MAIIRGVRKLLKSDFPEAPKWFENLLVPLNGFMDSVIGGLRNKLTFRENFYCEVRELTFVHDVELEVGFSLNAYNGLLIIKTPEESSDNYIITGWKARVIEPGILGVKVRFAGGGTTSGTVKFIILG